MELGEGKDERERIVTEELNYQTMLDREIKRIDGVIATYQSMESKKY